MQALHPVCIAVMLLLLVRKEEDKHKEICTNSRRNEDTDKEDTMEDNRINAVAEGTHIRLRRDGLSVITHTRMDPGDILVAFVCTVLDVITRTGPGPRECLLLSCHHNEDGRSED